jgi:hypothetical protein
MSRPEVANVPPAKGAMSAIKTGTLLKIKGTRLFSVIRGGHSGHAVLRVLDLNRFCLSSAQRTSRTFTDPPRRLLFTS